MRRGIDAIGPGAEINAVEVDFEDLVLAKAVLEPQRQQCLLCFAAEAAFRCQKRVFGELLSDRAATLNDMTRREIDKRSAQ